jgi:AraC family transcriptional regulator, regulatory protein of adaptative response / methylated-DNA-[protein]-cysteine methyltransferase
MATAMTIPTGTSATVAPTAAETATLSPEETWAVILKRDRRFDGQIFYGVRSTGIYCRPSCPSRRPRREQVTFFSAPDSAEKAGFRACRRCQPRMVGADSPEMALVRAVCKHISENLEGNLNLNTLGQILDVSPWHLQRVFKRVTGISPKEYAEAVRLGTLKEILRFGVPVTDAIYQAGYGSSSRVYERAATELGMTPSVYRRGGEGMEIGFTITNSPLGRLLVAATEKGVSAVSLAESDVTLKRTLAAEYPKAKIREDQTALKRWVNPLLDYLAGKEPHLDLPVDIRTTAFRWRVLQELKKIPYGKTATYAEIAEAIGDPKATRAVANACATNPVAVVIPCHRVVRKSGDMGGYRWGVERKEELLRREREALRG